MKLESIELINYKSIGTEDSKLIIEPGITTIIGMNESGKSNILMGLSQVSFTESNKDFFKNENCNRNVNNTEEMRITAYFKKDVNDPYNCEKATAIEISKDYYKISGGLTIYYDKYIKNDANNLYGLLRKMPYNMGQSDKELFLKKIQCLKNDDLNIPNILKCIKYLKDLDSKFKNDNDQIKTLLNKVDKEFSQIAESLPIFHYRNSNKILKSKYTIDEIKTANQKTDLIIDFLKVIGFSKEELISSITSQDRITITKRGAIQKSIQNNINRPFEKFYNTETISLGLEYMPNKTIEFTITSDDDNNMSLSERSNGLRWYINHYIDILANDLENKKVIYLLDEPGVFLHINAQKELLNLFKDLCNSEKGNQVIYTTHLPSMLDIEETGLHRIRAVKKDSDGNTHIFKNAYDQRVTGEQSQDTIAPVLQAIGTSATYGIYPVAEKTNIVVEGISDYIYITTIFNKLDLNISEFNFIPCTGVKNVVNICSILLGWGCKFIALLDYDSAGIQEAAQLKDKLFLELNHNYIFVSNVSNEDIEEQKTFLNTPFVIEDLVGKEYIEQYVQTNEESKSYGKKLKAKMLCNEIEANTINIPDKTKENFQGLYDRIILVQKLLNKEE